MKNDDYFDTDKLLEKWYKDRVRDLPPEPKDTSKEKDKINVNKNRQRKPSKETLEITKNARENSVKNVNKDFFSYFKLVPIKIIAGAMATMIAASSVLVTLGIGAIKDRIEELALEDEIDDYIVNMISPEKSYGNIMSYSAVRIDDGFRYDTKLLALEFAECDAELFDLLIYNAYENALYSSDDKYRNINQIFIELSYVLPHLQNENPALYYKLEGIDSFHDYLVAKKCVDEKGEPDLKKYEEFGQNLYEFYKTYLKNTYGGKSI